MPLVEIDKLAQLKGSEINDAKIILANEATKLCHGEKASLQAFNSAKDTFQEGRIGGDLPKYRVTLSGNNDMSFVEALCKSNLCKSKGEARRLIKGGGARINDQPYLDENYLINKKHFGSNGTIKISSGKKKHAVLYI